MSLSECNRWIIEVLKSGDLQAVRKLLREHAEALRTSEDRTELFHFAARSNNIEALEILTSEFNIDVNVRSKHYGLPINSAACENAIEAARWLIAHGARINDTVRWSNGLMEAQVCLALFTACAVGTVEMVRTLVEAGANVNGGALGGGTVLGAVLRDGKNDIAEYLRSVGALLPSEIPGFISRGLIIDYFEDIFGETQLLKLGGLLPSDPDVSLRYSYARAGELMLFTDGMSQRAMATPPGIEQFRYAELVMHLYDGWSATEDDLCASPEQLWPFEWLLRLAHIPFDRGTWLGHPAGIIANGEPPEPLAPTTGMTCWVLVEGMRGLKPLELLDRRVYFYHAMPIHTAERDFERREGWEALLELFERRGVGLVIDPERESVV